MERSQTNCMQNVKSVVRCVISPNQHLCYHRNICCWHSINFHDSQVWAHYHRWNDCSMLSMKQVIYRQEFPIFDHSLQHMHHSKRSLRPSVLFCQPNDGSLMVSSSSGEGNNGVALSMISCTDCSMLRAFSSIADNGISFPVISVMASIATAEDEHQDTLDSLQRARP